MKNVAKFEKVNYEQFKKDFIKARVLKPMRKMIGNFEMSTYEEYTEEEIKDIYDNIKLPKRGTRGSAGYDFFVPFDLRLNKGETLLVPTGIRCEMDEDWFLSLYPRSGLGFKFRLQLDNSVGIVDSDYYRSDNQGHIMVKLTNDIRSSDKTLDLERGKGVVQGIFLPYGITVDDEVTELRNGGFGSTDKNS